VVFWKALLTLAAAQDFTRHSTTFAQISELASYMSPTLTVSYTDPTCALPIILLLLSRFHFSRRYQSVTFPSNALSPGAYIAVLLIHDPLQPQSSIYDLFNGLQMSSEINVYHESASASCLGDLVPLLTLLLQFRRPLWHSMSSVMTGCTLTISSTAPSSPPSP